MIVGVVRRTIERLALLRVGDRVLVACSGGPDSVAMTHVLARLKEELGLVLSVATVDHGLRPQATAEVHEVSELAAGLGLPFYSCRLNITDGADLHARARKARYEALHKIASQAGASRIALGQHADDQAETVLARILRGSGLRGLAGINPHRDDGVIRPMIDCRRADIEAYVVKHGLGVVHDPSNLDPRFERARLRAELMPMLRREDPRAVEHLVELAQEANEIKEMLACMAAEILGDSKEYPTSLSIQTLRDTPPPIRVFVIRAWLEAHVGQPPTRAHLVDVAALLSGRGEVWLPRGWTVGVHEGRIVVMQSGDPRVKVHSTS